LHFWLFCAEIYDKRRIHQKKKIFVLVCQEPEKVSDESLVEAVLNLGDWDDVQELIAMMGMRKVADIFEKKAFVKRSNYDKRTVNFFNLYFARHA
jgi:hypothetical protein